MNTHQINDLSLDLGKKLSLYNRNYIQVKKYDFNNIKYQELASLILDFDQVDISDKINIFNNKYNISLELKNNRLIYPHEDISSLSSELYKKLYYIDKNIAFEQFIDFIQKKLINFGYSYWFSLSFDSNDIKEHFLNNATEYIIKNKSTPEQCIKELKKVDFEKHSWLRYIDKSKIPKEFKDINDLYFWFKKNQFQEYLRLLGSRLIKSLIYHLIEIENSTHSFYFSHKSYDRLNKIITNCQDDYTIMGQIFTSNDINLNIYFLTTKKYSIYGFINLYNYDSSPQQISTNDKIDYVKQWQEMLSNQLVAIIFEHFKYAQYKDTYSAILFNLLNYLVNQYTQQYNNESHYKANYTLNKVLENISKIQIKTSEYDMTYLFDIIIDECVEIQLIEFHNKDEFSDTNYYLLSWYLEQINEKSKLTKKDYSILIFNITTSIVNNINKLIQQAIKNDKFYINDEMIDKINFGLIYELTKDKNVWLNILNIKEIKELLNSGEIYSPKQISKFYFRILLQIYNVHKNKEVSSLLNTFAIEIGIKEIFGVFYVSYNENNYIENKFFEILNYFDDSLFNEFENELYNKNDINNMLRLYSSTRLLNRKEKIKKKILNFQENINIEKMYSMYDLTNAIELSSHNGFKQLSKELLNIYTKEINKNSNSRQLKLYNEIKYKNTILDIYYSDINIKEKFKKLNSYKIPFDDRNHGKQSKELECENYRSFIRAIIFYETEPIRTYKLLRDLSSVTLSSLYIINMLNAYFKAFENDINKNEKYNIVINEYYNLIEKFDNYKKTIDDYGTLLYGYMKINDIDNFELLWIDMQKDNQLDFNTLEIRCEYLQNNNQSTKALSEIERYENKFNAKNETSLIKLKNDVIDNIELNLGTELKSLGVNVSTNKKLVICVEGEFDIKFITNINQEIEEFRNIIDIKKEKISIFSLKGSSLKDWIEKHHLEGSNIIELHIFDSDLNSGKNTFQYKKDCDKVNNRNDKSICFLTKKREMENYIHKSLIEKEFDIDMSSICEWDIEDIPSYIQNKSTQKDEKIIKNILNGKLSKQMIKELLEDINGYDEIKSWFEKMKELSEL